MFRASANYSQEGSQGQLSLRGDQSRRNQEFFRRERARHKVQDIVGKASEGVGSQFL